MWNPLWAYIVAFILASIIALLTNKNYIDLTYIDKVNLEYFISILSKIIFGAIGLIIIPASLAGLCNESYTAFWTVFFWCGGINGAILGTLMVLNKIDNIK